MRLLPWDYAVRNLGRSHQRLALAIGGSTMVVLLVLAAAAFVRGMGRSLEGSSGDRNVLILGAGSEESVERSEIAPNVGAIAAASIPGIKERLGVPYVSSEIHMAMLVKLGPDDTDTRYANLRGVEPAAYMVHSQVRIVEGRQPGPGEILPGIMAAARMGLEDADLAVGRTLWFDDREWTVSGRFEAPGTVMEAEIWLPLQDLRVATQRDNLSCAVVGMTEHGDPSDVALFCKQRLDLELVSMTEAEYYGKVFAFYRPVRSMVWMTAIMVAAGAYFGGLNTLYASFAARIRELASLQAVGWSRGAILVSLVQESLLTSAAGSLLAGALALGVLDGLAVRISMGAFGLTVDGPVMATGMAAGLALGIVGALPPAWRCLGMPVAQALRAG